MKSNNNLEFGKHKKILKVEGWKQVEILYDFIGHNGMVRKIVWKIKDVDYIFDVNLQIIYENEKGEDKLTEHFKNTLIILRQDYFEFKENNNLLDWMSDLSKYIIL